MKRVLILGVSIGLSVVLRAGDWTNTLDGVWSDGANWRDGTPPADGEGIHIDAAMTSADTHVWLDRDVTFPWWLSDRGRVLFESAAKPDGLSRYGVTLAANATLTITNAANGDLEWAVPTAGAGAGINFFWAGPVWFMAPQTFTGALNWTMDGGCGGVDFSTAAVTGDATEDAEILQAKKLRMWNNMNLESSTITFKVRGRPPRAASAYRCRLTPGSPDLILLPTNVTARAVLSAGQRVSGTGIPEGAFIRRLPNGLLGSELVIALDRPVTGEEVTTQLVSFAAGCWTTRETFDELETSHAMVTVAPGHTSAGDGSTVFAARKLSGQNHLFLGVASDKGGTAGAQFELADTTAFLGTLYPRAAAQVTFRKPVTADVDFDVGAPAAWFDASVADSLTVEGGGVTAWRDARGGDGALEATVWQSGAVPAYQATGANGMPAIDFGACGSQKALVFNRVVTGVKAAFVVMDGAAGGGTLLGSKVGGTESYRRGFDAASGIGNTTAAYRVLRSNGLVGENMGDGDYVAIDGKCVELSGAGVTADWSVYTVSRPSASKSVSAFALDGCNDAAGTKLSGGQRLAEILLYTNTLTAAACQKIEQHLLRKWVSRAGARSVAFTNTGASVPPGVGAEEAAGTVTVNELTGAAPFEVKAGTRLEATFVGEEVSPILNAGSTLALNVDDVPTGPVTRDCVLWIDASNPTGLVLNADEEVTEVKNLAPGALTKSVWPGTVKPTVTTDGTGLRVIEMGPRDNGCALRCFTNLMASTVFLVWREHAFGCQPFGNLKRDYTDAAHPSTVSAAYRSYSGNDAQNFDFWRNGWSGIVTSKSSPGARNGAWYLDGDYLANAYGVATVTNRFMLHEGVMPGWGGRISCIGGWGFDNTSATWTYSGGFRLAEMLVYDRPLNETERLRTEDYLMRKWLPAKASSRTYAERGVVKLGTIRLKGNATLEAPAGTRILAEKVTGTGTLTCGEGVVLVARGGVSGVTVSAETRGVVATPGAATLAADPILHLDASDTSSITVYNSIYAKYWRDAANGIQLRSAYGSDEGWVPKISLGANVGLPYQVINFEERSYWQTDNSRYFPVRGFQWANRLTTIRTVFWMWRDHPTRGGGWLFGDSQGTDDHPSDFTRGNLGESEGGSAYFDAEKASEKVLNGTLRRNGEPIATTSVPTAAWHVLSLRTTGPCAADRIAADRACANTSDINNSANTWFGHWAGLQLGEVVVYDRALDDAEIHQTEAVLMNKWLGTHIAGYDEAEARGVLKAGTVVTNVAGSDEGYVAGLADTGVITFDGAKVTVCGDAADFAGTALLQNGATLVLGGTNYAAAVFNLKAGTTLDLGGQTVTVKQVKGAGRVVNGTLVGARVGAGTVIVIR